MGGVGGEIAVALADGASDDAVLGDGCRQTLGVLTRQAAHPDEMGAHVPQRRGEVVVRHGGVDRGVEPGDERVVRVGGGGGIRLGEFCGERGEHRAVAAGGGQARGRLLQRASHLEQFPDVAGVEVAHDGDARRRLHDEAVGGEAAERFAQRSAADAEAGGLLDLAEDGAGCEGAGLDLVEKRPVCAVTGSHHSPPRQHECIQSRRDLRQSPTCAHTFVYIQRRNTHSS